MYINIFKSDAGMQVGGGELRWMDLADPLGEAEAKPDTKSKTVRTSSCSSCVQVSCNGRGHNQRSR